ncbi:hypothetical protein GCM10008937_16920 [Deinococcus depolymerans]|uniref:Cytochrome c domain-containing protein n=1 Tax=Deinococcus depolymerans TaxID=392408 RepID=A0ABN1C1X6_9DEIO
MLSWALGVTAGLVLGVTLLIATPRLMTPPAAAGTGQEAQAPMSGADAKGNATPSTGTQPTKSPSTKPAAATPGPTPAAESTAPTGAGNAAAGEKVFAGNCAGCHGANGGGGIGPALNTPDGPKAWTDPQFLTALRQGRTPERELGAVMPRFSAAQISDEDVANIHAYIKTLN